ncbi:4Fe-4S binding protein [Brevibacillus sp. SYSU BS000544]|uniref:4Fe-4S binding protein n=1 Tax=Brevibacillus sp. SYSU BS000544 TaxID=3416443 RepID=UPI003CE478B8
MSHQSIRSTKRMRHLTQILFLIVMTITPIFDIFRLDMAESRFVILGKYFFINQLYLALIAFVLTLIILALIARNFGRIFCGWMCFQTTWSELGDHIIKKWQEFKRVKSSGKKISALAHVVVFLLLSVPLMLGFYTLLVSFFVAPKVIWSWITLGPPTWYLVLFAKFSVVGLIDLLIIRHSFCQSMCPYGIMQQKAKKNEALRITFDPDQCIDCNLCDKACLMKLKPRELTTSDPCINCAECIVACGVKAEKLAAKGIAKRSINSLSFGFQPLNPQEKQLPLFDFKTIVMGAVFVLFSGILLVGVTIDDGVDLAIKLQQDTTASTTTSTENSTSGSVPYELKIVNRTQHEQNFTIEVKALESGTSPGMQQIQAEFAVKPSTFNIQPLSKFEDTVQIVPNAKLPSGRYTIQINLLSNTGESIDVTKTVYYVY